MIKNAVSFLARQIYRVIFIWPFEAVAFLIFYPAVRKSHVKETEPNDFCFLITSVIYSKENKKVTYGGARSIFSPQERAEQTAHTIETIRQRIPQAKVVLIEGGLKGDLPAGLRDMADQYLYLGDKKLVRRAVDSTFKSLGETMMLLSAIKQLNQTADFYFKISGRYCLDDEFNINDWRSGGFVIHFIQEDYVSTRLYGFRKEMLAMWKYALIKGLPFSFIGYAIENTLAKFLPAKWTRRINRLGVTGLSATVKDNIIKE
ncbi:MAG: hypothetical protein WC526_03980 [Patescibacteria group bacterium]